MRSFGVISIERAACIGQCLRAAFVEPVPSLEMMRLTLRLTRRGVLDSGDGARAGPVAIDAAKPVMMVQRDAPVPMTQW